MASTTAGVRIKREKMEVTILPKKEGERMQGASWNMVLSASVYVRCNIRFCRRRQFPIFPLSHFRSRIFPLYAAIHYSGRRRERKRRVLLLRLVTTRKEAGVDRDGQKRGSIGNTPHCFALKKYPRKFLNQSQKYINIIIICGNLGCVKIFRSC